LSTRRGCSCVHQKNSEYTKPGDRVGIEAGKGDTAMSSVRTLHRKWLKDGKYRKAYKALEGEFDLARAVIDARSQAGLTQQQLAKRMSTSQSVIARLESGRSCPSTQTLERLAVATGTRLKIVFEPEIARR
jgi:ribosome-binding protein aMBF1 (putative translation factor)